MLLRLIKSTTSIVIQILYSFYWCLSLTSLTEANSIESLLTTTTAYLVSAIYNICNKSKTSQNNRDRSYIIRSKTRQHLVDFVVKSAEARLLIYAELIHELDLICFDDTIRHTLNAESFYCRISVSKSFLFEINQRKHREYVQAHWNRD